jgi:WS/DGAT/MGAT family acyltransferase
LRDTALPAPGSETQLRALAARIHSQALDRSKPLWELWFVQGLEGGRFALITKTHHALVDGVAGVDLATVLFDLQAVPGPVEHPDAPWRPRQTPGGAQMAARGLRGVVNLPFEAAARALGAARHPGDTLAQTREALEGLGEVVWAGLNPAPVTPLNVEIGPHRRLVTVRAELADFKAVKDAHGGTVNDVVIAAVTGACGAGCSRAACARRGSSCARWCRSPSARATSSTRWATGSPRCAHRCPSTSRTRSRACASCARGWTG